ncbi:MAG: hypothetical protein CVV64_05310 [Candidatus Wallbacteria bacterium HGW-Wallbacteria-1]|jgi:hypothetical protein|uniref:Uncharacterized protein n=1 Tax=Candidatus Wallbacteria bacterium HGW-Wallbacteria-1 TaxID=2013854 RepID=A0A2N1PS67_9BACT|nr:MAG: hypothetical protein CVV64_05310 [Candidatus Wallbacteria bacterium HGW-Wallbacteria-1]
MKNICDRARTLIQNRIDGNLDKTTDLWLCSHLDKCPQCSLFSRQAAALKKGTLLLAAEAYAPAELHNKIMNAVMAKPENFTGKSENSESSAKILPFRLHIPKIRYAISSAALFLMVFAISSVMIKTNDQSSSLKKSDKQSIVSADTAEKSSEIPRILPGQSINSVKTIPEEKNLQKGSMNFSELPAETSAVSTKSFVSDSSITDQSISGGSFMMELTNSEIQEKKTLSSTYEKAATPASKVSLTRKKELTTITRGPAPECAENFFDSQTSTQSNDTVKFENSIQSRGRNTGFSPEKQSFSPSRPFRDTNSTEPSQASAPTTVSTQSSSDGTSCTTLLQTGGSYLQTGKNDEAVDPKSSFFSSLSLREENQIRVVLPSLSNALKVITELCLKMGWNFSIEKISSESPVARKKIVINIENSNLSEDSATLKKSIKSLNPMIAIFPNDISVNSTKSSTMISIIISNVP